LYNKILILFKSKQDIVQYIDKNFNIDTIQERKQNIETRIVQRVCLYYTKKNNTIV